MRMINLSVALPDGYIHRIEGYAKARKVSKGAVIREALADWIASKGI